MGTDERRWTLLSQLRKAQEECGYVSSERIALIAADAGLTPSEVHGVASFYDYFKLTPPGRHSVRVCTGTACHVKGSALVLDEWERELGVGAGETTADGQFDLDEVACIGCCNLACAVMIDGKVEGGFKSVDVKRAIRRVQLADVREACVAPTDAADSAVLPSSPDDSACDAVFGVASDG